MLPPWTIEVLRRGLSDAARRAGDPSNLERIKTQASEILHELPQSAARSLDSMIRSAETGTRRVRRWTRKQTAVAVPMLNATGTLVTARGHGVPIAEEALEVGGELMAGDVQYGEAEQAQLQARLERLLPTSEHSLLIANNFSAALTAFSLLVQHHQLVVHRAHAVRLPSGLALSDAFGMLVPVIQEVGSNDRVEASDFDGLDSFCAVMADGGAHPAELMDLTSRDAMQAIVLPVATLSESKLVPAAESFLKAGADFVIMPGDGVAGGPSCGLLIGRRDSLKMIEHSIAWPALRASSAVQVMMAICLELANTSPDQLPVRSLISTSEENLRGRAERMATRLSGSDQIKSCQVTAEDARITDAGRWRLPSRQLRLQHTSLSATQWCQQLQSELPAVEAIVDEEALRIDLRWITPADDHRLAALIGGEREEDTPAP